MKIAIDAGHNCKSDRGAMGLQYTEDQLTWDLSDKLIKLLQQEGHQCILVTPKTANSVSHSLRQRVEAGNNSGADLFVSIHFNAANFAAFGSEVYAISTKSQWYARNILTEICKLGFYDRGVKNRNFFVLANTKMPAVLVECCFCDSQKDMGNYDVVAMAIAIKNGILNRPSTYTSVIKQEYLRINRLQTYLKPSTSLSSEIDSKDLVKLDQGVYTIVNHEPVEEGHFWVELKSGLKGFIYQGHGQIITR